MKIKAFVVIFNGIYFTHLKFTIKALIFDKRLCFLYPVTLEILINRSLKPGTRARWHMPISFNL